MKQKYGGEPATTAPSPMPPFPWMRMILPRSAPRIAATDPRRFQLVPPLDKASRFVPLFVLRSLSNVMITASLKAHLHDAYPRFPDELLAGTSLAIQRVFAAISSTTVDAPSNTVGLDAALHDMLTPRLLSYLHSHVRASYLQDALLPRFRILSVHDAHITDVFVRFGPKAAYPDPDRITPHNIPPSLLIDKMDELGAVPKYMPTGFMGLELSAPYTSVVEREGRKPTWSEVGQLALDSGVRYRVDIAFNADISLTMQSSENETLEGGVGKNTTLHTSWVTPTFEPAEAILHDSWGWTLADIDNCIEEAEIASPFL